MFLGIYSSKEREEFYNKLWDNSEQISYTRYYDKDFRSFRDFMNHTKSLYNFEALLIDISDLEIDKADDIFIPLKNFREYSSVNIVLIIDKDSLIQSNLKEKLIQNNIYNILNSDDDDEAFTKVILNGNTFSNTVEKLHNAMMSFAKKDIRLFTIPSEKQINIAIYGDNRVGSTTLALALCSWLKKYDIKARYVSDDYSRIDIFEHNYQNIKINNEMIVIKNIELATSALDRGINIFDNCSKEIFDSSDIKIICSTSKVWEVSTTKLFLKEYENIIAAFNLATDDEKLAIDTFVEEKHFYLPFIDCWNIDNRLDNLLLEHIRPLIEEVI